MLRVIEYVSRLKQKRSKAYSSSFAAYNVYGQPAKMPPIVGGTPSRPTESSLRQSRHNLKRYVRPIAPMGLKHDPIMSSSGGVTGHGASPLAARRTVKSPASRKSTS